MPYPATHKINSGYSEVATPSVGTTPQTVYMRVPFRSRVLTIGAVLGGTITGAPAAITVQNVTQGTTLGVNTVPVGGAGTLGAWAPASTGVLEVNENDVLSFTPAGATGANIPAFLDVAFRAD